MNVNELLENAKAALEVGSDYALAKKLRITQGMLTHYRNKRSKPNNRIAYELAEILDMPLDEVIASIEQDFAKTDEERAFWTCALTRALSRAASAATRKGTAILLAAVLAFGSITGADQGAPGGAKP